MRSLSAACLGCAVLVATVAPGVAAADKPLVLNLITRVETAREGTLGSSEPAKLTISLNRKLRGDEQVSVPLSFSAAPLNDLHLELKSNSSGVALSGSRVVFERGARRAVVRINVVRNVDYNSFTVRVPQQTSTAAGDRNSDDHIWLSNAAEQNGGLTVKTPSSTFTVEHLPTARIAPKAGSASVTEGDNARFVISLDGTWIGPGARPLITVDVAGSARDSWQRIRMGRNRATKNFSVRTTDDGISAGDRRVTATLIRSFGYWLDHDDYSAIVALSDNGVPQSADDSPSVPPTDDNDAQQTDTQQTDDQPSNDQPATPGRVLISHPQSGDEWLFPWEGDTDGTPFNYCAELDSAPSAPVTLTASASPDLAGADPLEFTAGAWGRQCFEVNANEASQNSTDELPRQVVISHTAASTGARYSGIEVADYTLYVHDDDPTTVELGASDTTAAEGDGTDSATLTVSIGRGLHLSVLIPSGLNGELLRYDEHIDVPLIFAGGTLDENFELELSGTPAGVTLSGNRVRFDGTAEGSATVATIKLVALDDDNGLDESISVSIPSIGTSRKGTETNDEFAHIANSVANNGGVELSGTATVAIADDDAPTAPPPPLPEAQFAEIWGDLKAEDSGTHNVVVELSEAQASDVTLQYELTRSATLGSDYTIAGVTSSPASVTVPAGDTSVTIALEITDDTVAERDESVRMELIDGDGYTVGHRSVHSIVITDNDEVTTTTVNVESYLVYVDEGDSADVAVWLGLALNEDVTIPLTVTSLTAESGDHGTISSITIPAGQTAAVAGIRTAVDADSDDETFKVSLGSPLPAKVTAGASPSTTIRIRDKG